METLLKQVMDKDFKKSNFTVYSILDEDGFISELHGMFNVNYSIDDFEYIMLDLSIKEKNAILYRMTFMMDKLRDLRHLIEKEIQDNPLKPKARVYVDKEKCFVFVAKLKEFNLKERINEIKKGDETEVTSPD